MLGKLSVFTGPMASGKTSKMIDSLIRHSEILEEPVLLIRHSSDTREYSTHRKSGYLKLSDDIHKVTSSNVKDVKNLFKDYNFIGIDESQFFPDIFEVIKETINTTNICFFVAGLDTDSNGNFFGETYKLQKIADSYEKLNAICKLCPSNKMIPAPFTKYIGNTKKMDQVLIGGLNEYMPVCRFHLN